MQLLSSRTDRSSSDSCLGPCEQANLYFHCRPLWKYAQAFGIRPERLLAICVFTGSFPCAAGRRLVSFDLPGHDRQLTLTSCRRQIITAAVASSGQHAK